MGFAFEPLNQEIFDVFFFNGAVIYEDYNNTVVGLGSIVDVVDYGIDDVENVVYFIVLLDDQREVKFSIMFDPETLFFFGPFG